MKVAANEAAAALAALVAYVATVLPAVRRELRRWRRLAEAMPDPERRRALAALEEKRSNVEAVAVFATLAPLRQRRAVLRAIVPLQLAIDYRDVLEEAGEGAMPADGLLTTLEAGWAEEFDRLPGCAAVAPALRAAVERCAEGQRRTHAAAGGAEEPRTPAAASAEGARTHDDDHGAAELRRWAESLDAPAGYRWWELAAGASSSVAAHALIAAAADPGTDELTAAAIDAAYFPPIGALTVFLDDLVDLEADRAAGEHSYLSYYEGEGGPRFSPAGPGRTDERGSGEAAERLGLIAERAAALAGSLPRAARHRAILAGVAAFYLSAPAAAAPSARPIRDRLLSALGPGARPLAAFVRLRRRAP